MSTDNFQSPLNKTRVDKFVMVINLPPALKRINAKAVPTNSTINLDHLQFSVFGTVVPDIVVPAIETPHTGSNIYISSHYRPPYAPQQVKFTIDNQFSNYWVIYEWLNLLRDEREGLSQAIVNDRLLASKDLLLKEYATILSVFPLDEFNNKLARFDYFNAFPTKLGGIEWNYQANNEAVSYFEFVFSNITLTRL